jgi:phosphohistidine phosphatase SixA
MLRRALLRVTILREVICMNATSRTLALLAPFIFAVLPMLVRGASAQTLSGDALVSALQEGGYVIVMRHASSPREEPDARAANEDNLNRERQLDEEGRAGATAMGEAIRALGIPVGEVLSSPTYRALETVRYAGLADPEVAAELGDRGRSMQGVTEEDAAWLQERVTHAPEGTNTLLVTHRPNITGAFPDLAPAVSDGEAVVFRPDGAGGAAPVARIPIDEWAGLR